MQSEIQIKVPTELEPELDGLREFVNTLDKDGKKSLRDFFQGARFMQSLMTNTQPPMAQDNT